MSRHYSAMNKRNKSDFFHRFTCYVGKQTINIYIIFRIYFSFHLPFLLSEETFLPSLQILPNPLLSITSKVDSSLLSSFLCTYAYFQYSMWFAVVSHCLHVIPSPQDVLYLMGQYLFLLCLHPELCQHFIRTHRRCFSPQKNERKEEGRRGKEGKGKTKTEWKKGKEGGRKEINFFPFLLGL